MRVSCFESKIYDLLKILFQSEKSVDVAFTSYSDSTSMLPNAANTTKSSATAEVLTTPNFIWTLCDRLLFRAPTLEYMT